MGTVPYLPFQAIKRRYAIEEIMAMTGIAFRREGKCYRAECPVHGGGRRSLVVTPGEKDEKGDAGVFYCFGSEEGGDRVALLAHVRGSKPYAIFKALDAQRPGPSPAATPARQAKAKRGAAPAPATVPEEKEGGRRTERGFRELPYLAHDHEAVRAMGLDLQTAQALGIGFAPRGHHKQRIAVPLRLADGRLAGYISILGDSVKLPPKWHL